jgi:glycosyltransferase involved in cell wall biosynthesis
MSGRQDIDVLHVIGSLAQGGAERNLYYLAPWMARSRLRYGICCLTGRGRFAAEIEALGIPVFELGYRKRRAVTAVAALRGLLKTRHTLVLHTHLFEAGVIGRLAAWLAGVPVIIAHEHGKTLWKKWYHRWFEALAIRRTDLRIAVSEDIRSLRIRHEHTPPLKIVTVVNAVEPAVFDVQEAARNLKRKELGLEGALVVGTVGRLVEAKRYDLFMEVAREVCAARSDARFLLVGGGHLRSDLSALRDSLGLADRVVITGPRDDIPELFAAMDLFVMTSRQEGLPVALIEAMMAAKPIVATAVGGIPEALTDGEEGVLVRSDDREGLAAAVLGLAADAARRSRMGSRARERANRTYSARAVLETLEGRYASILKGKGVDMFGQ